MGLDLTISVKSEYKRDKKGRNCYIVTELDNLKRCNHVLDGLEILMGGQVGNNSSHTIWGENLYTVLDYLKDNNFDDEYDILKEFLQENEVQNDDSEEYIVNAWW
jgi:hypothetical protein